MRKHDVATKHFEKIRERDLVGSALMDGMLLFLPGKYAAPSMVEPLTAAAGKGAAARP